MSSSLQLMMDAILKKKGIQWLTGPHLENIDKYARFLLLGVKEKEIKLASDDLNPILFENDKIIYVLKYCLNHGAKVQIIVHRGDKAEKAAGLIRRANPKLYRLWAENRDSFTIYWSSIFLAQPFLVISEAGVLFERPETDKHKRWQAISFQDKNLARKYAKQFDCFLESLKVKVISSS